MRYNYLSLHLNELLNQAIISFKRIRTGEEVEAIHQLRVNLKKINAIFRLLGFVIPEPFKAKEAFKSLKELFDLMGMVRDLQIARQIIAHSDLGVNAYGANLNSFINEQLVITRDLLLKWKKNHTGIGHFDQALSSVEKVKVFGKARWLISSAEYISNLKESIARHIESRKRDKWHKIRIAVKRIRFVIDWSLTLDKDFVSSDQYKKIRILGEILGDWHDRVIVIEIVELQAKNLRSRQQKSKARDFVNRLKIDQKSLLTGARFYLRDLLSTSK